MRWTDDEHDELIRLRQQEFTYKEIADKLESKFNRAFTFDSVRNRIRRTEEDDTEEQEEIPKYKETVEIRSDGSQFSDKLISLSDAEMKDPAYVMKAHGYDPSMWEMINVKSSVWHHLNKKMVNPKMLYASKITVKPRLNGFDFNRLIEAMESREPSKRIEFKGEVKKEKTYLEIPLFDLHMGNSTLEHYEQMIQDTLEVIDKGYQEILFIVGQDLFHNDNFKGETSNGTTIDKVDMEKAWDETEILYFTLIDKAIESANKVTVVYNKGNHDESMSYAFVRNLKSYYRHNDVVFDTEFKERKAHMLGKNFIGTTHGDKNRNNLAANFSVEFPHLWSIATTREVHIGHLHHKRTTKKPIELINDKDGLIVRELGTGNKIDGYHQDRGYTMAHSEFELFEYTETRKKRIHYV